MNIFEFNFLGRRIEVFRAQGFGAWNCHGHRGISLGILGIDINPMKGEAR